jgi:diguanylate cyclase (GGDEF)-like protein
MYKMKAYRVSRKKEILSQMHSIYFLSYAVISTVSAVTMAWAYYARFKKDGSPINYTLLLLMSIVALAMWTGAALTEFAYNFSPATAGFAAFFLGIIFSGLFAWQTYRVMRNIQSDKKTIEELSTRDSLTGLWNRRVFHECLSAELSRATIFRQPLALLMIDIDKLPEFNAAYSFKNGDIVLREYAARIMGAVRPMDRACRYVDGVVAVVLPKMGSVAAAEFAGRLKSALNATLYKLENASPASLTYSISIAVYPEHAQDEMSLIKGALNTLIAVRKKGGDDTCLFVGEGEFRSVSNSAGT